MVIITARKISTSRFDRVHIVSTSGLEMTSKPVSPAHPCGSLSPTSISVRTSLRRRFQNPPFAAPVGPASFIFGDVDIALFLRAAGEPAAGPDRDKADSG
jgi:hypothetical protein